MHTVPTSYNVHDYLKGNSVEELQAISKSDRLPFAMCMFNLEYDLNIANCIRSAHIIGVERVYVIGDRKMDTRGCVGSQNYIDIVKRRLLADENPVDVMRELIEGDGYQPILIDITASSKPIDALELYARKPCLVFGNENLGIPAGAFEFYPAYHIKQRGVIRSLNVSSAAAIAMYEVAGKLDQ